MAQWTDSQREHCWVDSTVGTKVGPLVEKLTASLVYERAQLLDMRTVVLLVDLMVALWAFLMAD